MFSSTWDKSGGKQENAENGIVKSCMIGDRKDKDRIMMPVKQKKITFM